MKLLCDFLESPDCRLEALRSDIIFTVLRLIYDVKVVVTLHCRHDANIMLIHTEYLNGKVYFVLQ